MISSAKYIIRLDDACPTMLLENWLLLERLFDEYAVRPVVGVIPDNRDPELIKSAIDSGFWTRIRQWQDKGWEIAMHGLHHVYHPISQGGKPLLPLADKSEFVGLSLYQQKQMLRQAYSIMSGSGVFPRAFMAPSHTFDLLTLQALREATEIRIITDGHALFPYEENGFKWLPQQLWRYYDMPFGIWCICLHPNTMSKADLLRFMTDLRRNASNFLDPGEALTLARPRSLLDRSFAGVYQSALKIKRTSKRFI